MEIIENTIRSRLNSSWIPDWDKLPNLDQQHRRLKSILIQSMVFGNNDMYFIIHPSLKSLFFYRVVLSGPRGCGKHLLLNYTLKQLDTEFSKSTNSIFPINMLNLCK